ncbi:MAG: O-antigen ligase family protein [Gammaproteobacteria bacterium]
MAVLVAVPAVLFLVFTRWGESLARQLVAAGGIVVLIAFSMMRRKREALLFGIIGLSQFAISLHSIEMTPPVVWQVFFIDLLLAGFIWTCIERSERFRLDSLAWIWIAYIAWQWLATMSSAHPVRSVLFLSWQIKFFLAYVLALNLRLTPRIASGITTAVAIVLFTQGAIAIGQFIKGDWIGLSILGEPGVIEAEEYFVDGGLRIAGTLGSTNTLAGYVAVLTVFLIPFVFVYRKPLMLGGAGAGAVLALLALSRAGWLAILVGASCAAYMLRQNRLVTFSRLLVVGLVVTLAAGTLIAANLDRVMNRFQDRQAVSSAMGRISQYIDSLDVIQKYPVLGIGPGITEFFGRWNNKRSYVEAKLPGVSMKNMVHGSALQAAVETGIPGLGLFLLITIVVMLGMFRSFSIPRRPKEVSILQVGGAAAGIAAFVHTSFGPEMNSHQLMIVCWLLVGISRSRRYSGATHEMPPVRTPGGVQGTAGLAAGA